MNIGPKLFAFIFIKNKHLQVFWILELYSWFHHLQFRYSIYQFFSSKFPSLIIGIFLPNSSNIKSYDIILLDFQWWFLYQRNWNQDVHFFSIFLPFNFFASIISSSIFFLIFVSFFWYLNKKKYFIEIWSLNLFFKIKCRNQ